MSGKWADESSWSSLVHVRSLLQALQAPLRGLEWIHAFASSKALMRGSCAAGIGAAAGMQCHNNSLAIPAVGARHRGERSHSCKETTAGATGLW